MATKKEPETSAVISAPPMTTTPAYDSKNLDDVFKRLGALSGDVQKVAADLTSHHRNATDPFISGRLHSLLNAIGEFTNAVGSYSLSLQLRQ